MKVLVVALLAGCWSASGTTPATPTTPGTTGADAPLGPPPNITWSDDAPVVTGLPAVSADGTLVMYAQEDSDAGRGFTNLAIVTVSRADQPVARENVITAGDEPPAQAEIDAKFAKANAYLVEQHRAHHFVAMHAFPKPEGTEDGPPTKMGDAGVEVDWDGSAALQVVLDGKPVHIRKTPPTWLAKDHPMYAGAPAEDTCSNPAHLGGGASDRARKIVFVEIAYQGTDSCWEPPDQLHVVSW